MKFFISSLCMSLSAASNHHCQTTQVTRRSQKNILLRLQFVVARGYNIFEVTTRIFVARGSHSLLWPLDPQLYEIPLLVTIQTTENPMRTYINGGQIRRPEPLYWHFKGQFTRKLELSPRSDINYWPLRFGKDSLALRL